MNENIKLLKIKSSPGLEQSGFISNHSTQDVIFKLTESTKINLKKKKKPESFYLIWRKLLTIHLTIKFYKN